MINATHGPGASRCNTLGSSGVVLHRVVGTRLGPRQAHSTEKAEVWAKNFSVLAETIQSKKTASEPPFLMGTFYPSTETFFFGCRIPFFFTKSDQNTMLYKRASKQIGSMGSGGSALGLGLGPIGTTQGLGGRHVVQSRSSGLQRPCSTAKGGRQP